MSTWNAMLDTWQDVAVGALVVAVVVAAVDRLRHAARRCNEALKSVAPAPEQAEPHATIPAQRSGDHRG